MDWIFWLILVIILAVIEIATTKLLSIWFVASGIITLILSFFIEDTLTLCIIFAVLGILLLLISRPIVNKIRSNRGVNKHGK